MRPLPETVQLSPSHLFRLADTIEPICSVLAVSHDLDGLLRTELCRSIAPCNQSWGPPDFYFLLPPRTTDLSQSISQTSRESHRSSLLALLSDSPRFQSMVRRPYTAPVKAREKEPSPFPQMHPPFEAFPSDSAVPGSPSRSVSPHRAMSPPGLPFSLLLGASFFHVSPDPFPVPAFPGFQVTSLNHKGLSRARVRCTDTPFPTHPCPLLPWAYQAPVLRCPSIVRSYPKSKINPRTETRPDAPILMVENQNSHPARRRARKPSIFPRPPDSFSSTAAEATTTEQTPDVRSAVSHERLPVQDWTLLTRSNVLALASSLIPPPCGAAPRILLTARRPLEVLRDSTRGENASSPLGPCFCSDFAHLAVL